MHRTLTGVILLLVSHYAMAGEDDHWDNQFGPPGADSTILSIATQGSDVYVGGIFTEAGGKPSGYLARWNETLSFAPTIIRLLNPHWQSGQFRFQVSGLTAGTYKVDATTNLVDWEEIYVGDAASDTNVFDIPSASHPQRAYRVRTP